MSERASGLILTLNSGSSSLKAALYSIGDGESLVLRGQIERIGLKGDNRGALVDAAGKNLETHDTYFPDHAAALDALFSWLRRHGSAEIRAVGHRIVHGGPRYVAPQLVTGELLAELRRLAPFDPMHLPAEIQGVEAVARLYPNLPQVACFDTAFHRTLPEVARTLALPRSFADQGIRRYGFHGLSYEYILEELARVAGPTAATGRIVIAHLGNGASMAAVRDGQCIDTTMGFTPTGGLVMGTRTGDLDPGVLLYLLREQRLTTDQLNDLVNHQSGLLGLSGSSSDMRQLLEQAPSNPAAALAVAIFCYQARKFVGALTAALGGLDTLIFTAGIGEKAAPIRRDICAGLEWLGVQIDAARNDAAAAVISTDTSRVCVRVLRTDEELMIARHTHRILTEQASATPR
ncbi:MAG TPA: acetate/propionate family kinase [Gemmataceae bacterium]|nr:acetate/propionate family kinase [Gemmataceae bacterium]